VGQAGARSASQENRGVEAGHPTRREVGVRREVSQWRVSRRLHLTCVVAFFSLCASSNSTACQGTLRMSSPSCLHVVGNVGRLGRVEHRSGE